MFTTIHECAQNLRTRARRDFDLGEAYDQRNDWRMAVFYRDHARDLLAEAKRLGQTYNMN